MPSKQRQIVSRGSSPPRREQRPPQRQLSPPGRSAPGSRGRDERTRNSPPSFRDSRGRAAGPSQGHGHDRSRPAADLRYAPDERFERGPPPSEDRVGRHPAPQQTMPPQSLQQQRPMERSLGRRGSSPPRFDRGLPIEPPPSSAPVPRMPVRRDNIRGPEHPEFFPPRHDRPGSRIPPQDELRGPFDRGGPPPHMQERSFHPGPPTLHHRSPFQEQIPIPHDDRRGSDLRGLGRDFDARNVRDGRGADFHGGDDRDVNARERNMREMIRERGAGRGGDPRGADVRSRSEGRRGGDEGRGPGPEGHRDWQDDRAAVFHGGDVRGREARPAEFRGPDRHGVPREERVIPLAVRDERQAPRSDRNRDREPKREQMKGNTPPRASPIGHPEDSEHRRGVINESTPTPTVSLSSRIAAPPPATATQQQQPRQQQPLTLQRQRDERDIQSPHDRRPLSAQRTAVAGESRREMLKDKHDSRMEGTYTARSERGMHANEGKDVGAAHDSSHSDPAPKNNPPNLRSPATSRPTSSTATPAAESAGKNTSYSLHDSKGASVKASAKGNEDRHARSQSVAALSESDVSKRKDNNNPGTPTLDSSYAQQGEDKNANGINSECFHDLS